MRRHRQSHLHAISPRGTDKGAYPFDPYWCDEGCDGPIGLGGSILRFPTDGRTYEGQTLTYRPVLNEFPMGGTVHAGQSWFFQFWFRDTSPSGPTSNFSPALFVPFQ